MLAAVLRGTAVARAAVAGLAVGLAALAGLALWSTDNNIRTTAWVRSSDEVSAYWSKTFLSLSIEGEALNDYVLADSELGRQPLESAVGSAEATMDWLVANGTPVDRAAARSAQETYRSYTELLREFLQAAPGRDRAQSALDAGPVSLTISTLQKQAITNMTRKRMESNAYLSEVEAGNHRLRVAEAVIGGIDLLLLALCAVLLLSHQRRIERQAVRDALTGLANRVLLGRRVQQALRAADRHGDSVGLLLLDLNGFKEVNDTLGHHAGDLLLQQIAGRLVGAVRDRDTVARLGGDEFAVVLPRMSSVTAVQVIAERLLAALQLPANLDGHTVEVQVSIGAAVYPLQCADAGDLMQHADIAMYEAKRRQSGTALYDPSTEPLPGPAEPALVGELRRALQQRELVLHYQPLARTDGAPVCGVEASVRWQHPVRGPLLPEEILPIAEGGDLIRPLTDYILNAALEQHRAWSRAGLPLPVSVDVTAVTLLDEGFPERLAVLLAEHGTPAGQLTLELPETAAVSHCEQTVAVIVKLRRSGVRVCIDDVGTGFSALAYLPELPLDELKIDRRLIASARQSRGDAAVVRAILELGRALHLEVVATGVDDESTLHTVRAMGCTVVQGSQLCRPMPAPALAAWLALQPHRPPSGAELTAVGHSRDNRPMPQQLPTGNEDWVRPV